MKYVSNIDNVQVTYPSYLGRQILVLTLILYKIQS